MGIFKKTSAVQIDKMNRINSVTITEENVKFSLSGSYSIETVKLEDVPKLLSDMIQLYTYVKPLLDKRESDSLKTDAAAIDNDKPIDLSEIPF